MSVTTHDIVVGVAALIAFPLALSIPAALASGESPDRGPSRPGHGEVQRTHPARVAAHVPR